VDDNPWSDSTHDWFRPSPVARTSLPERRHRDPLSDSGIGTAIAAAGSVVHQIAQVALPLAATLRAVAPLAGVIGCFFDKPNQTQAVTRTFNQPEVSFTSSDVPDSAVPLAMYKNSYLGVGGQVPDSQGWTWLKLAMTPGLTYNGTLVNGTSFTGINILNSGPLSFVLACHKYWRASVRVRIDFSCSTFTSANVLLTLVPTDVDITTPWVPVLDDTVSQTVVVKGDTVVEFTVPYIAATDMLPYGQNSGVSSDAPPFYGTSALCISILGPILTNDPSIDPVIDFMIWTAAGPDAQFSLQCAPPANYGTPIPPSVVQQCDIQEAFEKTFPPFVANCTYLTDNHTVTSEISDTIMDTLKRYEAYTYATDQLYSPFYSPTALTLGSWVKTLFLFHRGGVSYRVIDSTDTGYGVYMNVGDTLAARGQPSFWRGINGSELHFSIPWYGTIPYYNIGSPPVQYPASPLTPSVVPRASFVAVRDDYQMGFLIPPALDFNHRAVSTTARPLILSSKAALSLGRSFEFI